MSVTTEEIVYPGTSLQDEESEPTLGVLMMMMMSLGKKDGLM